MPSDCAPDEREPDDHRLGDAVEDAAEHDAERALAVASPGPVGSLRCEPPIRAMR